jgi:hypothetical protein
MLTNRIVPSGFSSVQLACHRPRLGGIGLLRITGRWTNGAGAGGG